MSAEALPSAGESTDAALWHACMDVLAQEVPPQQFNTRLKPLQARPDANGNGLVIEVANRFKLDWIRSQFLQRMEVVLEQLAERPVPIDLTIAARAPRPAVARAAVIQAARLQHRAHTAVKIDYFFPLRIKKTVTGTKKKKKMRSWIWRSIGDTCV